MLTVVIVNYNVRHYLDQCLDSVARASRGLDVEVVVVDNHSRDGSVEWLAPRHPGVRFISSHHNLGFARANNLAIRQTGGEYVLLLNPDTIVAEDTLRQVLAFMDSHPRAGACGVRMLQADGQPARESRRGLPSPMVAFYKMAGLTALFPRSRRFGHYYMGWLPWDEPARIEVVSGAFCLLRREALDRAGLLDEDFFMYGEDIDLSARVLKAGYENWYVPATILHYKGESTHKTSFRYVHVFYDAMLIFLRKHYGHLSLLLSLPIKAAVYLKATAALVSTVAWRTRRMLGFFQPSSEQLVRYRFLVSPACVDDCRRLAADNGLAEAEPPYDGSTVTVLSSDRPYADILAQPLDGTTLGIYHPASHTLITPSEVVEGGNVTRRGINDTGNVADAEAN